MDNTCPAQNQEIIKVAVAGIGLSGLFLMLAYVTVADYGVNWPWWPGIAGVLFCVVASLVMLPVAIIGRRAYQFQAGAAVITTGSILPLLAAGFELTSWSLPHVAWVLMLCSMNLLVSYRWTMKRLIATSHPDGTTARLDLSRAYWRLDRPVYASPDKERGATLARILIPLGCGLGSLLYRALPEDSAWFYAAMMFVLAFIMAFFPAVNAAAAVYLMGLERRIQKKVHI